jgi:two-component system, NarL family, sensor histidine kinase BarA
MAPSFATSSTSFRRMLLSRLLLLTLPALVVGEWLVYERARVGALEMARRGLTEEVRYATQAVQGQVNMLEAHVAALPGQVELEGDKTEVDLARWAKSLPLPLDCVVLDRPNGSVSTCGGRGVLLSGASGFGADRLAPGAVSTPSGATRLVMRRALPGGMQLLLQAQLEMSVPRSRLGSVVIVAGDSRSAHPSGLGLAALQSPSLDQLIGRAVAAARGQDKLTLAQQQAVGVLVSAKPIAWPSRSADFQGEPPFLARSPVVLALMPMDEALEGLRDIRLGLLLLTLLLLAVTGLVAIYLSRELARPVEALRDYALRVQSAPMSVLQPLPPQSQIEEFGQLGQALARMVDRLAERTTELVSAHEEAQDASRLKSQFLAATSHELRTPLNAILGYVGLLKDGCYEDRAEALEFLHQTDHASRHLLKVLNELLDIAKIESGTLTIDRQGIDLRSLLDEVLALQHVSIQQKGLAVVLQGFESPLEIWADRAKLKQILINVLGNAIKFTDRGSLTLNAWQQPSDGGTQVVLQIVDTGIGIDPSKQAGLFQAFSRAGEAAGRKVEGSGLGLMISRKLMELMDGTIRLYSPGLGQGTQVELILLARSSESVIETLVEAGVLAE